MERLTEIDEYGNADIIALSDVMPEIYAELSYSETNALTETLNKLAAYEEAEENGMLVRLPCKVGATVWVIYDDELTLPEVRRAVVMDFYIDRLGGMYTLRIYTGKEIGCALDSYMDRDNYIFEDTGKTVFFAYEEAEKALKERENNG